MPVGPGASARAESSPSLLLNNIIGLPSSLYHAKWRTYKTNKLFIGPIVVRHCIPFSPIDSTRCYLMNLRG